MKVGKLNCVLFLCFWSGEMDLATLVRTMNPCLMPEVYVFITLQHNDTVPSNLYQRFTFRTNTTETTDITH